MQPAKRQVLEDLRERIRRLERRPARTGGGVESGWPVVDELLPQGFPRGAVSELLGAPGSGKTALAASAVGRAMADRGLAAWIDARGELYAPAVQLHGVDLSRLLIVRPTVAPLPSSGASLPRGVHSGAFQALWAAEAVLGSGAFAAVVVDVPLAAGSSVAAGSGPPMPIETMLRRISAAAEKGGGIALWLSEPGSIAPAPRIRLEVSRHGGAVRARHAPRGVSPGASGHAA